MTCVLPGNLGVGAGGTTSFSQLMKRKHYVNSFAAFSFYAGLFGVYSSLTPHDPGCGSAHDVYTVYTFILF